MFNLIPKKSQEHLVDDILINLSNNPPMAICLCRENPNELVTGFVESAWTTCAADCNLSELHKELLCWCCHLGCVKLQSRLHSGVLVTAQAKQRSHK